MAAATRNRDAERSPSDMYAYNGNSGVHIYADTLVMVSAAGRIQPAVVGAGASGGRFLGVAKNELDLSGNLGSSNVVLDIWKAGIFTFAANGTGVSADIGRRAYIIDDATVGNSAGAPSLYAGEIVGMPTTSFYRVRIDNAVNDLYYVGLSGFSLQN